MARTRSAPGRRRSVAGGLLLLAAWLGVTNLPARDAFVLLSGGDSPTDNNYSQYLQAQAMANFLVKSYPPDSVWIFFGAGNVSGEKPLFGDVRRETRVDGQMVESWLPGALPVNRPARHDGFLKAMREEILPAVADGGTLYLFVGDHGSRTRGRNPESIIALWSFAPDADSEHGWSANDNEVLGVAELRRTLAGGLGKGRVVFCMTQCHAGGFNFLGIPRTMTADPKWFTEEPGWVSTARAQPEFPLVAGFTATDELSVAAGCDPDPDPANWAGYERYVPESLLGIDLYTGKKKGTAVRSFAEAHEAAILVDQSVDKPYSTSEQYLERWAALIETRLATERNLTPDVKQQVAAYTRTVDGAPLARNTDAAFRDRQAEFKRFTDRLTQQNPETKKLLLTGTRRQLEDAINDTGDEPPVVTTRQTAPPPATDQTTTPTPAPTGRRGQRRGGGGQAATRRLWTDTVRPAWEAAVKSNLATNLPAGARDFELDLLSQDKAGRSYFFGGDLGEEVFWQSGYSDPATLNTNKAAAVALWGVERRMQIMAWAKASGDTAVQSAAARLAQSPRLAPLLVKPVLDPPGKKPDPVDSDVAAARVLFYRRVLAAWQFLLAVNDRPALDKLKELTTLERTALPRPRGG